MGKRKYEKPMLYVVTEDEIKIPLEEYLKQKKAQTGAGLNTADHNPDEKNERITV